MGLNIQQNNNKRSKWKSLLFWRRLHVMLVSFFTKQGVEHLRLPHSVSGLIGEFWSTAENTAIGFKIIGFFDIGRF